MHKSTSILDFWLLTWAKRAFQIWGRIQWIILHWVHLPLHFFSKISKIHLNLISFFEIFREKLKKHFFYFDLLWVWERPQHSDGTRGVYWWPDFGEGVLRPHGPTPNLGVVEEEELVVVEAKTWQGGLLAVLANPFLVSLKQVKPELLNALI